MFISEELAANFFYYSPEKSGLCWKEDRGKRIKAGTPAGSFDKTIKYWRIKIKHKSFLAHRLVWILNKGCIPKGIHIDHKDRNTFNNCIDNLRQATVTENNRNITKRLDNTSGITGVCFATREKKWIAYISLDGKQKELGRYKDIYSAQLARKNAEHTHYNKFSPLGGYNE